MNVELPESARSVLLREATQDYVAYTGHYVFGVVFRGEQFQAWFNPYALLSPSLAVDLLSSAVLAFRAADPAARFETTLAVHVPEVVAQGRIHRSSRTGLGEIGSDHVESDAVMTHDDPMSGLAVPLNNMAHVWALLAPLALALTVTVFAAFPSAESCSGFLQLQLMTGVSGWLHCLVNVFFDGLILGVMVIPVAKTFAFYYPLDGVSNGSLSVEAFLFSITSLGSEEAWLACAMLPPCAVPVAVFKVIVLEWVRLTCDHLAATKIENTTALRALCVDAQDYRVTQRVEPFAGLVKRPVDMCCAMLEEDAPSVSWSPFELHPAAVGTELYILSAYVVLLFVIISCRNSGRLFCTESADDIDDEKSPGKDDVEAAGEPQKSLSDEGASKAALVASDLHKWYDDSYVVCGLSLELRQDECLGLLGVNGCGKSTVVRMLCGITSMSMGECRMQDVRLSDSVRGEDALMDTFTGNEILEFFARLRGVPGDRVHDLVGSVASVLDIGDSGLDLCETYSSGTRRKLSIAAAIIGCPRVAILDDATNGVDMIGREMIYETLSDLTRTSACAVLFTTRSTEECKLACQRVNIMAGGEVKALGTMDELREKFAQGCTISFRLLEKATTFAVTAVDKGVRHLFPGVRQAECREGTFLYYIDYRLPWSHVFSRINKLRRWFVLESVLVSESSLDEILLGLARAEQAEDAAEAKQAAKDASRDQYAGDPWGRDAQDQLERRQRMRDKRRRRNSPTHADTSEKSPSDGGLF
ncbi:hypothetical protein MRX96_040003 [Rhipicephalus microplus]